MKYIKFFTLIVTICLIFSSCSKVDKNFAVTSDVNVKSDDSTADQSLPEIMSLDRKMSKYFDISLFDEENYADIYLGKKFVVDATYADTKLTVPTTMETLTNAGWKLPEGSDYDENSLVFAKETVSLNFENSSGAKIHALFYNASNSSVRLLKCRIVKFRIVNNYFKSKKKNFEFNICGITNQSVITDIIHILGTPSHFYQMTEDTYYFDYFLEKRDRRNKIRIYVNLVDDAITEIEFSCYK